MSIEFVGDGNNFGEALTNLLDAAFGGPQKVISAYSEQPDPNRYMSVLDLFKDHQRRLDEARKDTETQMFTPRLAFREHSDIHLFIHALDYYMSELDKDLYNTMVAYGMGNDSETLESLTIRSREITEAATVRHMLDRLHTQWAREQEEPVEPGDMPYDQAEQAADRSN